MLEPIRRLMKVPLCGMTGNLNPEGAEFPQGNYFRPENIPQPEKIFDNSQQKIFELMRNWREADALSETRRRASTTSPPYLGTTRVTLPGPGLSTSVR
jgi:hypothetical protein